MKRQHKFSIWYALIGIWLVLIMHNVLMSLFAIKSIPYSEFLRLVSEQKVSEVAISNNMIQGKMVIENRLPEKSRCFELCALTPTLQTC